MKSSAHRSDVIGNLVTNQLFSVVFFDLGDTLVGAARSWLPGAKSLLKSFQQSEIRIGILSNTGSLAPRQAILDILPIDFDPNVFDPGLVLFSSEIGLVKPARAIFAEAIARASESANRCLYCSESAVETLVAQQLGMRAFRVQPGDLTVMASIIEQVEQIASSPV